jgi:hypothetical protein
MADTHVGSSEKMSAAEVAKIGFEAMMKGELEVVAGFAINSAPRCPGSSPIPHSPRCIAK